MKPLEIDQMAEIHGGSACNWGAAGVTAACLAGVFWAPAAGACIIGAIVWAVAC